MSSDFFKMANQILGSIDKVSRMKDRTSRARARRRNEERAERRLEIQEERLALANAKHNNKINKEIEEF